MQPTGSVFGGDALVIDAHSSSSSPIDPDDKYSVFRSQGSKHIDPVLAPTGNALDSPPTSTGWSSGITSMRTESFPTQATDSNKADVDSWADFQSSSNVTGFKSVESSGIKDFSSGESHDAGFNAFQKPDAKADMTSLTTSLADMTVLPAEKSLAERNQGDFGLFEEGGSGFASGETGRLQIEDKSSLKTDNDSFAIVVGVGSVTEKDANSNSGKSSVPHSLSATVAEFNLFDSGNIGSGSQLEDRKQMQSKEPTKNEFGDFGSIDFNPPPKSLFPIDNGSKAEHDKTQVTIPTSGFEAMFAGGSKTSGSDAIDDSWNEFTSFAPVPGSPAKNDGATTDFDSKKQDILATFSAPFEKKKALATEDASIEFPKVSLKDESSLSNENSAPMLQDSSVLFSRSLDSHQQSEQLPASNVDKFNAFFSEEPVAEKQIPASGVDLAVKGNSRVTPGVSTASEFADFASFGSSDQHDNLFGHAEVSLNKEEKNVFENLNNCEGTLSSSISASEVLNANSTSKANDFHFETLETDPKQTITQTSALDDLGEFGNVECNENLTGDTKSHFVPSQRMLDVNEQLSSFAASTSAGPKDVSFQSKAYKVVTNLPQKSTQESGFVDPVLDVKDRYKALTGVLEVRKDIMIAFCYFTIYFHHFV